MAFYRLDGGKMQVEPPQIFPDLQFVTPRVLKVGFTLLNGH